MLGLCGGVAFGNYTATQGAGTNFGSVVIGGVHFFSNLICDMTTANQCAAVSAAGAVKVDNSAVTQPVSAASNIPVSQATAANLNATVVGTGTFAVQAAQSGAWTVVSNIKGNSGSTLDFAGQNAVSPANSVLTGGQFNTSPTTISSGNSSPLQLTSAGSLHTTVDNTNANGQATMANSSPVVIASNQSAIPISGSLTANQSVNVAQFGGVSTSTGQVAVSTAPVTATNTALVVDLRPDSPGIVTLGPATAANSVPVTIGPTLLGSYCMAANTGTMAAGLAGGSPIYSFRYGGANLAIIRKITAEADDVTTAFVAGSAKFDLIAARTFSASDTGGTAATLTGNNGKMRTSFATTAISDLRISSTATLSAGTRTLDAQPLATVEFSVSTTIDAQLLPTTDLIRQNVGESPLVLANNEGFVIQATVPGTGTWFTSVRTCWDEVTAF